MQMNLKYNGVESACHAAIAPGILPPQAAAFLLMALSFCHEAMGKPSLFLRWHQDGQPELAMPEFAKFHFCLLAPEGRRYDFYKVCNGIASHWYAFGEVCLHVLGCLHAI